MTNTFKVASVIAKEALDILDNNLVMGNLVHRAHENEFSSTVNGYKKGASVTIRRPADFTVTDGATMVTQDITEGAVTLTVDKRKHVAFEITSQDMTLSVSQLSERVIKPAVIQLANQIDRDLMALYSYVPGWVGTPGQTINSYADFAKGPQRLDEYAVPMANRNAVLSPADHWGMLGSQTALYMQDVAKGAYRSASLGMIGGIDTYMSQNVPAHTNGAFGGTVKVDAAITASTISYADVKDTMTQTLHIDGLTSATAQLAAGDTFTIAGVYAVNPVTKARLDFLKEFTVVSTPSAASSNEVDLTIYPAMIWSGAHKNVDVVGVTDLNNQDLTFIGTASTAYRQNMVFHKNAFALAMVPLEMPAGSVGGTRQSYKGINLRVVPVYDGINDVSAWRIDVLYGVKAIDPRLATRISGAS
jgi:hypothetical protein